jgi:hypothetical protein
MVDCKELKTPKQGHEMEQNCFEIIFKLYLNSSIHIRIFRQKPMTDILHDIQHYVTTNTKCANDLKGHRHMQFHLEKNI